MICPTDQPLAKIERKETLKTLNLAGTRLEKALNAWNDDHNRLKEQHKYDPSKPQITPSTSVPDALLILASSLAFHNTRAHFLGRSPQGLIDLIQAHIKPRSSTVTRDWHVKRCLAEVEQDLLCRHDELDLSEKLHASNLEGLRDLQRQLLEEEQGQRMAVIFQAVHLADGARHLLDTNTNIRKEMSRAKYEQLRWQVERAVDEADTCHIALMAHDRSINILLRLTSLVAGRVPRQRMITEFFKARL
ncbi:hypothetical protein PRZ48_003478 [Zasmidium cellare]|uniref:Uncharacterized protein n=1 Tax=Zasmidium cellare TaxID=395010 RepID=A0ABR0EWQ3_ZASCE|nr:hypothetical protein PRZ48_003478 [Zasmidium cellare]